MDSLQIKLTEQEFTLIELIAKRLIDDEFICTYLLGFLYSKFPDIFDGVTHIMSYRLVKPQNSPSRDYELFVVV